MKAIEIIFSTLLVLGGVAFVVAIIRYPKDFVKLIKVLLLLPLIPFIRVWYLLLFFLSPLWILILKIEKLIGFDYLSRLSKKIDPQDYKTESRKNFDFSKFNKYIFINTTNFDPIEKQLTEANETCQEVNIQNYKLSFANEYSIIEVPSSGFYSFNFLIQWLTEHFRNSEVYGFATNGRSKFFSFVDHSTENNLIGSTSKNQNYWVSMYDDLDNKQYLRLCKGVAVDSKLNTDSFERLIKNAI